MRAYVLRRLLLMIPTFFGVSLILFVVLNLAPGRPGADRSTDLGESMRSEVSDESSKIFREQFYLDRPVLLNTRFALDRAEVRAWLETAAGLGKSDANERAAVQERLADLGNYGVPHFVALLDDRDPRVRDAAAYYLR